MDDLNKAPEILKDIFKAREHLQINSDIRSKVMDAIQSIEFASKPDMMELFSLFTFRVSPIFIFVFVISYSLGGNIELFSSSDVFQIVDATDMYLFSLIGLG